MEALETKIVEVIVRTPTIKSFRFAVPDGTNFKPGQFLQLAIGADPSLKRPLSFSNSPSEGMGFVEATKKITQSKFSQALNCAKPGDSVLLRFPMGRFTFNEEHHKIALLSGGIGITPLRSIAKHVIDNKLDVDVCLLYSNRTYQEIAFREDFEEMLLHTDKLRVVHTLTAAGPEWCGRRGRIDANLIKEELPDYAKRAFYLCGPPKMVLEISAMLRDQLQIAETQILAEKFTGY